MSAQMLLAGVVLLAAAAVCGQWQAFAWRDVSTDSVLALAYLVGVVTALTYPVYFGCLKSARRPRYPLCFCRTGGGVDAGLPGAGRNRQHRHVGRGGVDCGGVVALTLGQRGG